MNNKKLNEKLAKWAGFKPIETMVRISPSEYATWCWELKDKSDIFHCLPEELNFTSSLDVCFKWLVPKLLHGQCELHSGMNDKRGKFFAMVWHGMYQHKEAYAKTPALAICEAIVKLIETEGQ